MWHKQLNELSRTCLYEVTITRPDTLKQGKGPGNLCLSIKPRSTEFSGQINTHTVRCLHCTVLRG